MGTTQLPTVLLAEDSPDDQFLVRRTFDKLGIQARLDIVHDGAEAIEYLSAVCDKTPTPGRPLPALVLLDIKMPRRTGFDVLQWMRHDRMCKLVPVVMLSSSDLPRDVARGYELGANAYVMKSSTLTDSMQMLKAVTDLFLYHACTLSCSEHVESPVGHLG